MRYIKVLDFANARTGCSTHLCKAAATMMLILKAARIVSGADSSDGTQSKCTCSEYRKMDEIEAVAQLSEALDWANVSESCQRFKRLHSDHQDCQEAVEYEKRKAIRDRIWGAAQKNATIIIERPTIALKGSARNIALSLTLYFAT